MITPPPSQSLIESGFSSKVVPPTYAEKGKPLVLAEAPGRREDEEGITLHPEADAGGLFTRLLTRVGVKRERMTLANTVWQRPPKNELYNDKGQPMHCTHEAIAYWKPFVHQLIEELEPPVIIGLGRTALEVLTGFSDIGTTRGYVHWGQMALAGQPKRVACDCGGKDKDCFLCGGEGGWDENGLDHHDLHIPVTCTYHPQFLNYGQKHLSGVFIRDVLAGLEIAEKGWHPSQLKLNPLPTASDFAWFCASFNPDKHILTSDIETPNSRGLDEDVMDEMLEREKVQLDIDRMSFCYDESIGGWSIPFVEPFVTMARELIERAKRLRGWNWRLFDWPRLQQHNFRTSARVYDLLDCWRHLHRTLPASLAFVAPFYYSGPPWKQEAHIQPETYSAQDSLMEHICGEGMARDLRARGEWSIYERHVVDILGLTTQMAESGLPYDALRAKEFERELQLKLQERLARLNEIVPKEVRPKKTWKTKPRNMRPTVQFTEEACSCVSTTEKGDQLG